VSSAGQCIVTGGRVADDERCSFYIVMVNTSGEMSGARKV